MRGVMLSKVCLIQAVFLRKGFACSHLIAMHGSLQISDFWRRCTDPQLWPSGRGVLPESPNDSITYSPLHSSVAPTGTRLSPYVFPLHDLRDPRWGIFSLFTTVLFPNLEGGPESMFVGQMASFAVTWNTINSNWPLGLNWLQRQIRNGGFSHIVLSSRASKHPCQIVLIIISCGNQSPRELPMILTYCIRTFV